MTKQYTFTREILNDHVRHTKNSGKLRLYKIIDSEGNIAAQFYSYPKKQVIEVNGKEIVVSVVEKFFKETKYLLIDSEKNEPIGEYKYFGAEISYFWQDVPTEPNGTITLDDILFYFRRIPVGSSPFDQEPPGYYHFRLYAVMGDEYADYKLNISPSTWLNARSNTSCSFAGAIETNSKNITAMV